MPQVQDGGKRGWAASLLTGVFVVSFLRQRHLWLVFADICNEKIISTEEMTKICMVAVNAENKEESLLVMRHSPVSLSVGADLKRCEVTTESVIFAVGAGRGTVLGGLMGQRVIGKEQVLVTDSLIEDSGTSTRIWVMRKKKEAVWGGESEEFCTTCLSSMNFFHKERLSLDVNGSRDGHGYESPLHPAGC